MMSKFTTWVDKGQKVIWKNNVRVRATIRTHHVENTSGTSNFSCTQKMEICVNLLKQNKKIRIHNSRQDCLLDTLNLTQNT